MRFNRPAALGLLLLSLTGCGYALVGRASSNVHRNALRNVLALAA